MYVVFRGPQNLLARISVKILQTNLMLSGRNATLIDESLGKTPVYPPQSCWNMSDGQDGGQCRSSLARLKERHTWKGGGLYLVYSCQNQDTYQILP